MMIPPNASNVPFGGIPPELSEYVDEILSREPEVEPRQIPFQQNTTENSNFSFSSFLQPYAKQLSVAFILVVIATLAQQAGPMLTAYAIDNGIKVGDKNILLWCFLLYLASIAVNVLASYIRINYTGRLAQKLLYELRLRVFSQLQRLSLEFYTGEKMGRLLTRMTSDIEALSNLFNDGLVNLAVQGVTLVIISGCLFYLNPELAAILLLVVSPVMILLTLWFKKISDEGYERVRDKIADIMADLQENLAGFKTMIAFNRREHNIVHHRNLIGSHRDENTKMSIVQYSYDGTTTFINAVGQITILLFGFNLIQKGELTVGELVAFQLFLTNFFGPLQNLVQLYNGYQSGNAAIKKLADLFNSKIDIPEKTDAIKLPKVRGDTHFKNVHFSYQEGLPILKGVNLDIKAGETIAFVGPTGAGKSTIAKLITRFYDPNEGQITIDGYDLRDLSFQSLRSQISAVPQEAFLFHGSLRYNLAFSREDISDEEIIEACELMGITSFIEKQSEGLDTQISERGASLSSGEKQLIALARAFIAKPGVLILDEATSNIDLATEKQIEKALDVILGGRTAIIIAHRLATAMRANRIAFIDHGEIIEFGSHEELISKQGPYASFYQTWQEQLKDN